MAADAGRSLLLARGRVLVDRRPRDDLAVLVRGTTIERVGPAAEVRAAAPDAMALELAGRTVIPGLVDAHLHISSLALPQPELARRELPADLRAHALGRVARSLLDWGVTTVRDAGSYGDSLFTLRDAIRLGLTPGPRLVLSGQIVAATSPGARLFPGMYQEADGPDAIRAAVRAQIRRGADFVKTMVTGALTVPDEEVEPAQLTAAELGALVEEAHRLRRSVAAHAEGVDGIRLAVDAGADTIEHGELAHLEPELLDRMAAAGTILVPTLSLFEAVGAGDGRFPAWMVDRGRRLGEAAHRTLALARSAGVAIAVGADAGPYGPSTATELVRLVDAGLPAAEALAGATGIAARACGLERDVGAIAPGFAADLLVVDGDVLAEPRLLTDRDRLWLVIAGGQPVAGRGLGPATTPSADSWDRG